jgi:MFS transporter, ACS family, tartrate transporter
MRNSAHAAVRRVWWRIVPLLALVLLLSYLDKVNIGFAALQMNSELHLSNTVFGVAAGLFAISYAAAAIPGTLLLQRVGARRWISLVMVVWGICSASTALVTNARELMIARIALGAAEAGFTPGVIFYLNSWFPSEYRGRVLGSFLLILPLAVVIGGPLSALLLACDGAFGLSGWKWLFLIEGLPTVLIAILVFRFLPDSKRDAPWLRAADKEWLAQRLNAEAAQIAVSETPVPAWRVVVSSRVSILALAYLGISTSGTGALIFLPLVIRSMGFSVQKSSVAAALPALIAALALPAWGMWADRARSREIVVLATCLCIAAGLVCAAALLPSSLAILPLTLAFVGFFGSVAPFWTLPSSFLTGARAAMGIAAINVAGNLGNFCGPALLGWLVDRNHSYAAGLIGMSVVAVMAGAILGLEAWRHRVPDDDRCAAL